MLTGNDREDAMDASDYITRSFSAIRDHIHSHAEARVDTGELITIVEQIEQEVKQGSSANLTKIERWLGFLEDLSPDTLDVTIQTLLSSGGSVAEGIRSILQKIKDKRQGTKPLQRDILEGKWMELRRSARGKWDDLSDDEWDQISGRRERLSGVLQEKYGYSEMEAERRIDDFLAEWDRPGNRTIHGPDFVEGNLPGEPTTDGPDPD